MKTKILGMLAAATLIAGVAGGTAIAEEEGFTEAQKSEMHTIIRNYLIENPDVIREALEALQAQQEEQERLALRDNIVTNADMLFRSELDYVHGNPQGDVTMVEFFDYNCGYCKRSLDDVLTLIETDPGLRVVFKEFPILGPGSMIASRAAIASKEQGKYWEFHLALMQARGAIEEAQVMRIAEQVGLDLEKLQADMQAEKVDRTIQQNYALAEMMGIQGTPAFLIDDRLIPGALGIDGLRNEIVEVRGDAACVAC